MGVRDGTPGPCAVPAERVNIALRRAMSISFAVTSASRAARRWSAVKRPTDQMNETSDSEHQSQHAAKDDHRHQRSEKGCRPDTPRHPEPHDQGTHQRHPRVLHPRLGRQPTQRLHRNGWSADDPRGRPQRLSTHGRYFGRGSVSLNSLRRGTMCGPLTPARPSTSLCVALRPFLQGLRQELQRCGPGVSFRRCRRWIAPVIWVPIGASRTRPRRASTGTRRSARPERGQGHAHRPGAGVRRRLTTSFQIGLAGTGDRGALPRGLRPRRTATRLPGMSLGSTAGSPCGADSLGAAAGWTARARGYGPGHRRCRFRHERLLASPQLLRPVRRDPHRVGACAERLLERSDLREAAESIGCGVRSRCVWPRGLRSLATSPGHPTTRRGS